MASVFWHVGLTVSDIEHSTAFYRDVAGMDEGPHMYSANEAFGRLVNNPGATLDSVFLTLGGFTLQLLQYRTKGGVRLQIDHHHIGSPHLSLFVPNARAKYDELVARRCEDNVRHRRQSKPYDPEFLRDGSRWGAG